MWAYIPSTRSQPSRESEPSILPSSESFLDAERSLTWRSKRRPLRRWLRAWQTAPWIRRLSTLTLPPSRREIMLDAWLLQLADESTSSMAVAPAPTSASPGREPASEANGRDSSSISYASFASYDPATCSWRTSQPSLFGDSTPFSGSWPKAGSMRSGVACERPTLARHIAEIAGGASPGTESNWPTPNVPCGGQTFTEGSMTPTGVGRDGTKKTVHLSERVGMWTTPCSDDTGTRTGRYRQGGTALSLPGNDSAGVALAASDGRGEGRAEWPDERRRRERPCLEPAGRGRRGAGGRASSGDGSSAGCEATPSA
jgi:hypothetical protein